ncbi:hypothetical protein Y032_0212g2222 [Ancylostoma ceylanicum]|nr:hypothetical protein Y032_0212g2222 [Ancylostoma ceylanicum]
MKLRTHEANSNATDWVQIFSETTGRVLLEEFEISAKIYASHERYVSICAKANLLLPNNFRKTPGIHEVWASQESFEISCVAKIRAFSRISFVKYKKIPNEAFKLEQIERIDGRLIVVNNAVVKDLSFFKNLKEINNTNLSNPSVFITNNKDFDATEMLSSVNVSGKVQIYNEVFTKKIVPNGYTRKPTTTGIREGKATTPKEVVVNTGAAPGAFVTAPQKTNSCGRENSSQALFILLLCAYILPYGATIVERITRNENFYKKEYHGN